MDWRGKLNQQAVTGGRKYSPEVTSSLRRRDLQAQYEQEATRTPAGSQENYVNEGFKSGGNLSRTGTDYQEESNQSPVVGSRISGSQQVGGQSPGPTDQQQQLKNQAVSNFGTSLRENARAYREARDAADREKQTQMYTKMGTGTVLGALTGGPAGAMIGFGSALLGPAIGEAFGNNNFEQRMEQESYRDASNLYDAINVGDGSGLVNWRGEPVSKQEYIMGTIHDLYNTPALDDAKRADLLKKLGLDNTVLGTELGYEIPDISSPEFSSWAKQAVPGWNYEDLNVSGGV